LPCLGVLLPRSLKRGGEEAPGGRRRTQQILPDCGVEVLGNNQASPPHWLLSLLLGQANGKERVSRCH